VFSKPLLHGLCNTHHTSAAEHDALHAVLLDGPDRFFGERIAELFVVFKFKHRDAHVTYGHDTVIEVMGSAVSTEHRYHIGEHCYDAYSVRETHCNEYGRLKAAEHGDVHALARGCHTGVTEAIYKGRIIAVLLALFHKLDHIWRVYELIVF